MCWEINFALLKKVKETGHCLCNLQKVCPCWDFIDTQECKCGVFKGDERES